MLTLTLYFSFLFLFSIQADVYINEICTNNKNSIKDIYGSSSDYIELYNSLDSSFDLTGYSLSNEENNLQKYTFPENTFIKPKSFLLIFLSKEASKDNEIHCNFKLSKKGDILFFSDKSGAFIEKIDIPAMDEDYSYGRNEEGNFEIMPCSPLKKNIYILPPPEFSVNSGFYPNNFVLYLISSLEDSIIYYTIDGSNPLISESRIKYDSNKGIQIYDRSNEPNIYAEYGEDENSPISIARGTGFKPPNYPLDKSMIVRAITIKEDSKSKIIDKSYFITTGNLIDYQDYLIISLVTNPENLFDPEKGIYVTGKQYIDWISSPGYIPNPDKWSKTNICNYYSKGKEWERDASVSFFEKGNLLFEQNIGIRLKGSSTRNSPQKSFDLITSKKYGKKNFDYKFFEENYDLNGKIIEKYDTITLRAIYGDERLRDKFGRDIIYQRKSITTSWMKNCILFLNGEYWGMYELMEKLTPLYFEYHYGIKEENLVIIKENEIDKGPAEECERYLQIDEQYSLLDLSNDKNYKEIEQYFDIDSFIEHYAVGIYLGTWDWPLQNQGMWKYYGEKIEGNEFTDGKWRFMTYDLDFSMGLTFENYGGVEGYQYDNFKHIERRRGNKPPTNLFLSFLKNEYFKNKFINLYCDYVNDVMHINKIISIINDYAENVTWMFANSKFRWWNDGKSTKLEGYAFNKNNFENKQLKYLETFFQERGKNTLQHMKEFLSINGELVELTILKEGEGKIKINTIEPEFKEGKWCGKYFSGIPINISVNKENSSEFKGWSGDVSSDEDNIQIIMSRAMIIKANF